MAAKHAILKAGTSTARAREVSEVSEAFASFMSTAFTLIVTEATTIKDSYVQNRALDLTNVDVQRAVRSLGTPFPTFSSKKSG